MVPEDQQEAPFLLQQEHYPSPYFTPAAPTYDEYFDDNDRMGLTSGAQQMGYTSPPSVFHSAYPTPHQQQNGHHPQRYFNIKHQDHAY
jgi:hypothetical protein